jgi:hypothetical protein
MAKADKSCGFCNLPAFAKMTTYAPGDPMPALLKGVGQRRLRLAGQAKLVSA